MKKLLLLSCLLALALTVSANNIKVDNVRYDKAAKKVTFELSWENAWRQTNEYHDAAWVFAKYRTVNSGRWLHALIKPSSTSAGGILETKETNDKLGFFVRMNTDSTGDVLPTEVSFEVENIIGLFPDFQVFATEMVYVPEGAFYAGAPAGENYLFYGDNLVLRQKSVLTNFTIEDPIYVSSENELKSDFSKQLIFDLSGYEIIPATFPKGYAAFYCMKHEVSNDQFVQFLNNISHDQQWLNLLGMQITGNQMMYLNKWGWGFSNFDTVKITGTKTPEGYVFNCVAKYLYYPALMTPITLTNYLAWAGLVPMTELQYEKACRGPLLPVSGEVAAGINRYSATYVTDTAFQNLFTTSEKLKNHHAAPHAVNLRRCGFAADSATNRISSNATFYGILNMTDNVLEITVSLMDMDTNKFFTGTPRKTESGIYPHEIGFNCYLLRSTGENGITNVLYIRTDENVTNDHYNEYDMRNIAQNSGINIGYMYYPTGGRGVRKPQ